METKLTAIKSGILMAIFLTSCHLEEKKVNILEGAVVGSYSNGIETQEVIVYELDSCEYIGSLNSKSNDWMTHKGNCKYCKQRNMYGK